MFRTLRRKDRGITDETAKNMYLYVIDIERLAGKQVQER